MRSSTIFNILSLLLPLISCSSSTDKNITFDDRDPRVVLSPLPAWASSDQAGGEQGGTFSFSNRQNATAVFAFTQNASAVFWQGFKRTGPALYSVCLDCTDSSEAQLVDAHDPDPQSINSVTTLFSKDMVPNGNQNHILIITNLVDPRFGSASQITLDSFIITCSAAWSAPPVSTAISSVPTPSSTAMPDGQSPSAYWSTSSSRRTLSTGVIVGIAFAVAIALLGAVGLAWWLLRRRNMTGTVYRTIFRSDRKKQEPMPRDPESPMFSTLKIPPRNAEQASMFDSTVFSDLEAFKDREKSFADSPQFSSSTSPLTRSTRPPSIRSALSTNLSREPSACSAPAQSEWGTIPVVLNNPFSSPSDSDADSATVSEFDFSTPLPSSELGSTFAANDERQGEDDACITPKTAQSQRHSMRDSLTWRSNDAVSDGERTPTLARGWRRVEV